MTYLVATFYKFVRLPDYRARQSPLLSFCQLHDVCGTILLAEEGINGTIAGEAAQLQVVLDYLRQDPRLADLTYRSSEAERRPFQRMKVKLKQEIVTFGQPNIDPQAQAGTYVDPKQWNQLIADPDVLVIDTRNDYEVKIGSFQGAVNPHTEAFREFPDYVQQRLDPQQHRKVAMFCTGGIRCEKASAYLRNHGFDEVYHLQGGILSYLEQVPAEQSLWEGECFVFDERVAVKQGLEPGTYGMCFACGHPISETDQASEKYVPEKSCPHCWEAEPVEPNLGEPSTES